MLTLRGALDREVEPLSPLSTSQSETESRLSTKIPGRFARFSKSKAKRPSTLEFPRKSKASAASPQIAGYHTGEPSPVQVELSSNPSRTRHGKGLTAVLLSSDDDSDPILSKPNRACRNTGVGEERSPARRHSMSRITSKNLLGKKASVSC